MYTLSQINTLEELDINVPLNKITLFETTCHDTVPRLVLASRCFVFIVISLQLAEVKLFLTIKGVFFLIEAVL